MTKGLRSLLKEDKLYTFVGFSIEGDKQKLKESDLDINPDKYIDIHRKWRVTYMGGKRFHSLDDVVGRLIHAFYKHMKQKIDREETINCGGSTNCLITSSSMQR
ncbi:hypothetical protein D1007_00779 [Hordeum vulgare]|nr:hypothetical protein D1007_00779 [Hordeum vulgare]